MQQIRIMNYHFGAKSRIKSKKQITQIFKSNTSGFVYPIKFLYTLNEDHELGTAQVLITVPKRGFKLAVNRNKIKRLIRESYRLHKPEFEKTLLENRIAIDLAFIYTGKNSCDFNQIDSCMERIIYSVERKLSRNNVKVAH